MIVIVEQNWVGHHPTYFSQIVHSAAMHEEVLALCPEPESAKRQVTALGDLEHAIKYQKLAFNLAEIPFKRKLPALYNEVLFSTVNQAIKEYIGTADKTVYVIFCCLYHGSYPFYKSLERAFPYKWSALMINTEVCESLPTVAKLKQWRSLDPLKLYHANNCQSVFFLEHEKRQMVENQITAPLIDFPDICSFELAAESAVLEALPDLKKADWPLVGVLGHISSTKSILELIRAAQSDISRTWGILVGGELNQKGFSEEEYNEITSFLNNDLLSFSYLKRIEEPLYNAFLAKISVFFLCYKDFYRSSNNMIKGAYFKKPMMVLDHGCMAMRLKQYKLGVVLNALENDAIIVAIDKALKFDTTFKDAVALLDKHANYQVSNIIQKQLEIY